MPVERYKKTPNNIPIIDGKTIMYPMRRIILVKRGISVANIL